MTSHPAGDNCVGTGKNISRKRDGITVTEVLVCIAILGLLMALLSPSVLAARESARQLQCLHNLRQIGIACGNHVSTHSAFPFTCSSPGRIIGAEDDVMQLAASPHAFLMASIDVAMFDKIDFSDRWLTDLSRRPSAVNKSNRQILTVNIPLLRCPSDRPQPGANNYRANVGIGIRASLSRPEYACWDRLNGHGAFVNGKAVTPADFSDGLSNTVLFSEKLIGDYDDEHMTVFRDRYSWEEKMPCTTDSVVTICKKMIPADNSHQSFGGSNWLSGGLNATWYNHVLTPNSHVPDCSLGDAHVAGGGAGIHTARSFHRNGVNVLMADSSGRFVSQNVDLSVWQATGTRNGEEPLQDF